MKPHPPRCSLAPPPVSTSIYYCKLTFHFHFLMASITVSSPFICTGIFYFHFYFLRPSFAASKPVTFTFYWYLLPKVNLSLSVVERQDSIGKKIFSPPGPFNVTFLLFTSIKNIDQAFQSKKKNIVLHEVML